MIKSLANPNHKDEGGAPAVEELDPTTIILPFGPKPSISSDIALEFGAVARITCAPPSFCNSAAAFWALLSMYALAPSFLARAAFSYPRPMAATL